jgi:putative PIN family toxin of toxin-antitoxin system
VLDTNILLRGLLNIRSAVGGVVDACDQRRAVLLLSRPVLAEYRAVLTDSTMVALYPALVASKIDLALRRLRYVGDIHHALQVQFDYPRDPRDAKFIELAIAGNATHIVSGDKDLLQLASGHGDSAKRFRQRAPSVKLVDAASFLNAMGSEFDA